MSSQPTAPQTSGIALVLPQDLPALDRLFQAQFHHPLDLSLWTWKYTHNKGFALGTRNAQNELITHYGALTRAVMFHGQPVQALQMVDVVASPKSLAGVSRRPPIYLAVKHIAETYLGLNKPYLLAFGFPNRRAYDVFERLGIYQKADNIFELSLIISPQNQRPDFWHSSQRINTLTPAIKQYIDYLWLNMAQQTNAWIVPIKNAEFFAYRYFSHPVNHYEVFAIRHRITQRIKAVFILKKIDENQIELLDFVCPLQMIPALVRHVVQQACQLGSSRLTCWATNPLKDQLAPFFDSTHDINVIIPTNAHTPSPPMEQIFQKWWLMGGDTDFK